MGVKESHPSSLSIFRRERLSTMTTSCPWSLRYNEVGHPQNPSPPKIMTFFLPPSPFAAYRVVEVEVGSAVADDTGLTTRNGAVVKAVATVKREDSSRTLIFWSG